MTSQEAKKSVVQTLWPFLRNYRWELALALLLLLIGTPLSLFHPLVWKYVVDHLIEGTENNFLVQALVLMTIVHLFSVIMLACHNYLLERIGKSMVRDLREAFFKRIAHQTFNFHHDHNPGELVTRVVSDVDAMEDSVLRGLMSLLSEFLSFLWVAGIVIALQPVVGTAAVLPLVASFCFIKIFHRRLKEKYDRVRKALGRVGEFVHDRLAGISVIQAFALESAEQKKFSKFTEEHRTSSLQAALIRNLFFPAVGLFGFMSSIIMLGLGVLFILKGEFTIGGLIAYRGYWWRLQSPISTMAQTTDILQRARAAAERIVDVLNEPIAITDSEQAQTLSPKPLTIAFEDVSFTYPNEHTVLNNINFTIKPGETVAIAGKSGMGKSTLLNILYRFYEPTSGKVLLNGGDYREYTLQSLRQRMAVVFQDTYLFNENLLDNIRYALPDKSEAEVIAAAQAANAHTFIEQLPQGYATVVGHRGVKLSGGQRQRISLARAFLANPDILLLDEPTSSVDPESEKLIHQAIQKLCQNRTTLIVTHRITLLQNSPRILFFSEGTLFGEGNHQQLISTCPAYAEAYEAWKHEDTVDSKVNFT